MAKTKDIHVEQVQRFNVDTQAMEDKFIVIKMIGTVELSIGAQLDRCDVRDLCERDDHKVVITGYKGKS